MNRIVKLVVGLLVCGVFSTAQAQDLGIAVKGGLNFNTISVSGEGIDISGLESKIGFHLGVAYETPISDFFFAETGLLLDTRGFKKVESVDNSYVKGTGERGKHFLSLTLPVVLKGKYEVADDLRLFAEVGVHLNYLLSGTETIEGTVKYKSTGKTETEKRSKSIDFSQDDAYLRFGYGLIFGAGVEYKQFIFGLSYDLGLRDYDKDKDITTNFNAFKIGLGYKF